MKIYCLEDFKVAFEKLRAKKAYRNLEKEIIDYFFGKSVDQLFSGTRLNNSEETPYIKKKAKRKWRISLLFSFDYHTGKSLPHVRTPQNRAKGFCKYYR